MLDGIDRSGILGHFANINGGIAMMSDNKLGLHRLLGVEGKPTRFQVQNPSNLFGPTGRTIHDTALAFHSMFREGEFTEQDVRRFTSLLVGQNWEGFRYPLEQVNQAITETYNLK